MAKALLGHISGPNTNVLREAVGLRRRVADLEAEILRLQVRNDLLAAALNERDAELERDARRERQLVEERAARRVLEPMLR